MRLKKEDYLKIEKAFISAYQSKKMVLQPGEEWPKKVMENIRQHRLITTSVNHWEFLQPLAWQISSVACLLIGLLMILLLKVDFALENEMAQISFDQPIEASYIEIPGT